MTVYIFMCGVPSRCERTDADVDIDADTDADSDSRFHYNFLHSLISKM